MNVQGLDVSSAQSSEIDWGAVRAAGKRFVYVKVNTGEGAPDPWYLRHARGARTELLLDGAYTYVLVDDDPRDDVKAFLDGCSQIGQHDLPPMLDLETRNGADVLKILRFLDGWRDEYESQTGRTKIVLYTGPAFWKALGAPATDPRFKSSFSLAVSHYGVSSPAAVPPWGNMWSIWQSHANTIAQFTQTWTGPNGKTYAPGDQTWGWLAVAAINAKVARLLASPGTCPGVRGEVDLDEFNGTYDDMKRWAGLPVAEPTLAG